MMDAGAITPPIDSPLPTPLANVTMSGACAPWACQPQKCSPVRPQPVCTSSEIHRIPCSRSTSRERAEQPVRAGGEPADALDRLGDERRDVAARLVEHLAQVGDAGGDELAVGQARERRAVLLAAVHVVGLERRERRRATTTGCR